MSDDLPPNWRDIPMSKSAYAEFEIFEKTQAKLKAMREAELDAAYQRGLEAGKAAKLGALDAAEERRKTEDLNIAAVFRRQNARIAELEVELARLREALEFYADDINWQGPRVSDDRGYRARAALETK